MSATARVAFRLLAGWLLLMPAVVPLSASAESTLRRPVDIGFIRLWPSHGGAGCLHGLTGAGCRHDCEPNGDEALEEFSGIFYQCPVGTPVLSAAVGVVLDLRDDCDALDPTCQAGWGNWVLVEHPFGQRTLYAHLSETLVLAGDPVDCGAPLGLSGATGSAPTEGLYFELRDLQYAVVDPFSGACNPDRGETLWVEQTDDADCARSCAEAFVPNEQWIGAPCERDDDCRYEGAVCLSKWTGGTCSGACEVTCPAHPGTGYSNPVCMLTPDGATCVAGCSNDLFPETGCRNNYLCQWLSTPAGTAEPGCLPEPGDPPDGGVPDGDSDVPDGDFSDTSDADGDAPSDGGPDITVGGDSPACACRSPASKRNTINLPFLFGTALLISGLRKRFFRCPAKVNVI